VNKWRCIAALQEIGQFGKHFEHFVILYALMLASFLGTECKQTKKQTKTKNCLFTGAAYSGNTMTWKHFEPAAITQRTTLGSVVMKMKQARQQGQPDA
jgi:hypothetical protein